MDTSSSDSRNLKLSPEEYSKRLWDWTFLNVSFSRGIRLADIDGFVEANNKFLFIEGKPPNGRMKRGQQMALQRLAALPDATVIVLKGNPPNEVVSWEVIGDREYLGNKDDFAEFVRMWFQCAAD